MASIPHAVYFWFSLIFLIARTLAVSLYSAEIYDQSKKPVDVLRAIPNHSWCTEARRFSEHVVNDTIALTGMRFFYLTRKLILTVRDKNLIFDAKRIAICFLHFRLPVQLSHTNWFWYNSILKKLRQRCAIEHGKNKTSRTKPK